MFWTYLPQIVKLRPETATEPASAFSAGLCSKKNSFSELQDAENRLYKESDPAAETPPPDLEAPADLWLYRKSLDLRCRHSKKW